jgi:excisionase family DNA binding protein
VSQQATLPYPKHLTVQEAADALRVTPQTIRRMIKDGKLKAKHAGRRLAIKPADLDEVA